jgi:hypothetical protein
MPSVRLVTCTCGREYNVNALNRCPACRKPYGDSETTSASSTGARPTATQTPSGNVGQGRPSLISRSADEASAKATSLMKIAATVSVIGIIGSILTMVAGLLFFGDDATFAMGILLVAAGISGILLWVFIGSLAQTLAAGVKVLAESARR